MTTASVGHVFLTAKGDLLLTQNERANPEERSMPSPLGLPETHVERLRQHGFQLQRRLGRGAFGTVYLGTQSQFKRPVAVKFFNADSLFTTDESRTRFEREALLLAKVEHPGIPYVITAGRIQEQGKDTPYYVMQFVEGKGLDLLIEKQKTLSLQQSCKLMIDVLDALQAVHNRKILHRDVKPNNILVGSKRTWLVDFSLGASLEYSPGLTRATAPLRGVGVPDYSSPEQKQDAKSCDHRTDIYSCGVVLFEMLAGHAKIKIDDFSNLLPSIPPALCEVLHKATASNREERFESAEAFQHALVPFISVDTHFDDEGLALCNNPKCSTAKRSENGYFFAPRMEHTKDRYCDGCGNRLVRRCPQCHTALTDKAKERVTKLAKSEPDAGSLYCSGCGCLIFDYPMCKSCGSLLKYSDLGKNTETDGCAMCSRRQTNTTGFSNGSDVPF